MNPATVAVRCRRSAGSLLAVLLVVVLAACATSSEEVRGGTAVGQKPDRFTIVPDDYHVPHAGTAGDGRRFFLSDELFARGSSYVGLFLWNADGTFDEVKVDEVARSEGGPPGQAAPAGADDLVAARLAELGDYVVEPVEVAPFTTEVEGVTFGWRLRRFDGDYTIHVAPGDFIAYYEPWDGLAYDT